MAPALLAAAQPGHILAAQCWPLVLSPGLCHPPSWQDSVPGEGPCYALSQGRGRQQDAAGAASSLFPQLLLDQEKPMAKDSSPAAEAGRRMVVGLGQKGKGRLVFARLSTCCVPPLGPSKTPQGSGGSGSCLCWQHLHPEHRLRHRAQPKPWQGTGTDLRDVREQAEAVTIENKDFILFSSS